MFSDLTLASNIYFKYIFELNCIELSIYSGTSQQRNDFINSQLMLSNQTKNISELNYITNKAKETIQQRISTKNYLFFMSEFYTLIYFS